jgi:beta-glucanase (GH16 family)
MELNKIFGTLHYPEHFGGNGNGNTLNIPSSTTAFHEYVVEWDANNIKMYVDGALYHTVGNNNTIPFNHNFFILLNMAIGGSFGGKVDPLFSIDTMQIDYVRVFQTR